MSEEKISDLDKRLAVLTMQVSNLEKSITEMRTGQNRLLFVVAAAIIGGVVKFMMDGGFSNVAN